MEEIAEGFSLQKVDCIYCSKFDKEQLKAIEAREEKLKQAAEVLEGVDIKEVPF